MNLLALRNDIANLVDYDPEINVYKNEITRLLNDVYISLFNEHSWKFAEKSEKLTIYADQTTDDGQIGNSIIIGTAGAFFESWMAGSILEISGSTNVDGEYEITSVNSTTSATLGSGDYTPSALVETGIDLVVKQRYIDLPVDCANLISGIIRNYEDANTRYVLQIPRIYDEVWNLSEKNVGTPYMMIPHEDAVVMPPVLAPTLTDGGAGVNGVPTTGTYEVAYSFTYQNRESSLSPPTSITMTAGDEIDISDLVNTAQFSGIRKQLYFKHPNTEAWYKADTLIIDETTTTATLEINANWSIQSDRALENDGVYKRIRLYPRQNDDFPVVVRYTFRPTELVETADTPSMPTDTHKYLVYRACEETYLKHNNLSHSEVARKKADKLYIMMQNRHLNNSANWWVKGNFTTPSTSIRVGTGGTLTRK